MQRRLRSRGRIRPTVAGPGGVFADIARSDSERSPERQGHDERRHVFRDTGATETAVPSPIVVDRLIRK